jgi:hypothetical protein
MFCEGFLEFVDKVWNKKKQKYDREYWECNKCHLIYDHNRKELKRKKNA